jgi:ABC-2 type transport system permease protein
MTNKDPLMKTRTSPPADLAARFPEATRPALGELRGAVAFEWTKLTTLRSTWWSLITVALLTVGVSAVIGLSATASAKKGIDATQPAPHAAAGAIMLTQLAVVVLATLAITSEYATGSITTTLQSVPTRARMLASKILVVTGVAFVTGLLASALGTLSAATTMGRYGAFTVTQAIGTAFGVATYLAALGGIALGTGALLRSAAGTITALGMLLLAIPQILSFLSLDWVRQISDFLPSAAGTVLMTQGTDPYGTGTAIAVLALWAATTAGGGYAALRSRDV